MATHLWLLVNFLFAIVVVKSHVCVLKKRLDPSGVGGVLRWSLPYDEICYCQRVIAPRRISHGTCPRNDYPGCLDTLSCNLWFVDDPKPIKLRQNWNKEALDRLLERVNHCVDNSTKTRAMKQDNTSPTERSKQNTPTSTVTSLEETTTITARDTTRSSGDVTSSMAISKKQTNNENPPTSVTVSIAEHVDKTTVTRKDKTTEQTTAIETTMSMETTKKSPMIQGKITPTDRAKQDTTTSILTSLEGTTAIAARETTTSSEDVTLSIALSTKQTNKEDPSTSVTVSIAKLIDKTTETSKEKTTEQTTAIDTTISMEKTKTSPVTQGKISPTERAKQDTIASILTSLEGTTTIAARETTTLSEDVTSPTALSTEQTNKEDPTTSVNLCIAEHSCLPIPLGMQNGDIPDVNITASSYQTHSSFDREPKYARLGSDRYWNCIDPAPWIQVDLGSSRRVIALLTEGNYEGDYYQYWVEQVKVQVGMVEENLIFIEDKNGQPKVFNANSDPNTIAEITLDVTGICTQFVRIHTIKCVRAGETSVDCLFRFEIAGCR